ncbi:MAG: RsmE family RNA methyltransferase [Syntrophothermus sp.]
MASTFLSDTELYYAAPGEIEGNLITLSADESTHIIRVMRHRAGDNIYITDGTGNIFLSRITETGKNSVKAEKVNCLTYENNLANVIFCIPKLKSTDRFEFALEKCVELGITGFMVYDAEKSLVKGNKPERWQKIAVSAMKQSLRSYLPVISSAGSLKEIMQLEGKKVIFDQNAQKHISQAETGTAENYYFIFGPEAGLSRNEQELVEGAEKYRLTPNRLRAETAAAAAASAIALKYFNI